MNEHALHQKKPSKLPENASKWAVHSVSAG
jgi:hypothetical protein